MGDKIEKRLGYLPTIINARFIKPLDEVLLSVLCKEYEVILTIEEGCLNGGFGSAISDYLHDNSYSNSLKRMGIQDKFIDHASRLELLAALNLTPEGLISVLQDKEKKHYA